MGKKKINVSDIQKIETYVLNYVVDLCESNNINYSLYCGSILGCVRHGGSIPWDTDVDIIISIEDYVRFLETCQQLPDFINVQYYPADKKYNGLHPRIGIKGIDIEWIHVDVFIYSGLPDDHKEQLNYIREARKKLIRYHRKCEILFYKGNLFQNIWRTVFHSIRSALIFQSKEKLFYDFIDYSNKYKLENSKYITEIGCNQYGEKKIFKVDMFKDTVIRQYEDIEVRIPKEFEVFLEKIYGNWREYPSLEEQNRAANIRFEVDDDTISFLTERKVL